MKQYNNKCSKNVENFMNVMFKITNFSENETKLKVTTVPKTPLGKVLPPGKHNGISVYALSPDANNPDTKRIHQI